MPLKMEYHSKWNVTLNGISLQWNVTQMECHKNGMSQKIECHSKWNVTQNGMSPKIECHSK